MSLFSCRLLVSQCQGFFAGVDGALQLSVFDCAQQLPKEWTGKIAGSDEIVPGDEGRRPDLLGRQTAQFFPREIVEVEPAMAAHTIQAVQFQVFIEFGKAKE